MYSMGMSLQTLQNICTQKVVKIKDRYHLLS